MADLGFSPGELNLSLYKGDTFSAKVIAKDGTGNTLDLTGWAIKALIYAADGVTPLNFTDGATTIPAEFQIGSKNLGAGEIFMFLPDGATSQIPTGSKFDVEISKFYSIDELNVDNNTSTLEQDQWVVLTIIKGTITVVNDITYSTGTIPVGRGQIN